MFSCFPRYPAWALSLALFATAFVPISHAEIVINEVMYHPAVDDVEDPLEEYIEIHNTDESNAVDLTGWRFTKGIDFDIPDATMVPPGGFLVIAADVATFSAKYPAVTDVVGGWTGKLSNSGERIKLNNALGEQADEVVYSDQGEWANRVRERLGNENGWAWDTPADGGGNSLELMNPALSNKRGRNWGASADATGSPGAANSIASTDIAPIVHDVTHSPVVPNFSEAVTVSATLDDEGEGLAGATLRWRISTNGGSAFESLSMNGPDANGIHSATIPPQAEDSIIEFYIDATDGTNARTWPAPTDQGQVANALYQVDSTPAPAGVAVYRAIMTVPDKDQFDGINRQSDAQINVTFVVSEGTGDSFRHFGGVRIRGNGSRNFNPPPVRMNVPRDEPLNSETKLNINSRFTWLQALGMEIFSTAGVATPRAKRVQFWINGEDDARADDTMRGSFVHLQPIGSEFLDEHFPDDAGGNLYKKRSAPSDRDEKRWGVHFEDQVVYNEPNWYRTDNWSKLTNDGEDDWSDLQSFVETMHQAGGPNYVNQIRPHVDIEQWVRWFAIMAFLNNHETSLGNGIDDDYSMYRGEDDTRFKLLPHDLDTIFGEGDTGSSARDSIFPMLTANIPRQNEDGNFRQLVPFFEDPDIRLQYFTEMRKLLENELSKPKLDALVRNHLAGWATAGDINAVISYADARREHFLGIISGELTVNSGLPVVAGFPQSVNATASLSGSFNAIDTLNVRVNGQFANVDYVAATWNINGIQLLPGINRITIESDDPAGQALDEAQIDIWYDDGDTSPLAGTISVDTTLDAAGGPYTIAGEVIVAPGATLTVEAGTNFYLDADAKITVNGVMRALGTKFAHVRVGPVPDAPFVPDTVGNGGLPNGPPKSDGIQFVDTLSDQNLLRFVDVLHAQGVDGSVGVHRSEVLLDAMTFAGTHIRMIYADSSSVTLQNSVFPNVFEDNQSADALGLDNISEHVKGEGSYPAGGHFIIRDCVFGTNKGHNDVIDVDSGRRPDPILQILDNVFIGAGDEALDLGGDVYVAGNVFMNIFKDDETSDRGYANGISTGDAGSGTTVVAVRNVFWDVDHAINLKIGTSTVFENNTVVKIHDDFLDRFNNPNIGSAINFYVDEPGAQPGDGAYAANNIFWQSPRVFGNADLPAGTETPVEMENNLISQRMADATVSARLGTTLNIDPDSLIADPHFVDELGGNFALLLGSPARGAGTAGQDLGAAVPEGIFVTGEPASVTTSNSATLTVGGPGIFAYTFRVDGGTVTDEMPIGNGFDPDNGTVRTATIQLENLAPGPHSVEVWGQDYAGNWQVAPTLSKTWTVDPNFSELVINEVLAASDTTAEFIELYNSGASDFDLANYSVSDDPSVPAKFIFPAGTAVPAGGYLVVEPTTFSIDGDHEIVGLYDAGGILVDSIEFGHQLRDKTVGRTGRDGNTWALTVPTPGAENIAHPYGDPTRVVLNEWLATSDVRFKDDFVELFNSDTLPVALGDFYISDDPQSNPTAYQFPPLSFIGGRGYSVLRADANPGARHLPFKLAASDEWLLFSDFNLNQLDLVHFQCETSDVSQGRFPDGSADYADFTLPTPGVTNNSGDVQIITETLVPLTANWAYEQSNTDLGTEWVDLGFNANSWPIGPGLLYSENDPLAGPEGTQLALNPPTTHYFRHQFNFSGNPQSAMLEFDLFADDGAVVYLNGVEIVRVRMPAGPISHTTFANDGQGNASREGPFAIPSGLIVPGANILAAQVHQDDNSSSDVVFGLELRSGEEVNIGNDEFARVQSLLDALRVTEIMYNPAGMGLDEFIEVQNISNETVQLQGVRFTSGIDFTFPAMLLGPGEYVIVVQDVVAFEAIHGDSVNVAGVYGAKLDNGGEQIVLQLPEPYEAAILCFEYDDAWYPTTDDGGHSLEIANPQAPINTWSDASSWVASAEPGGTPAEISPPVIISPTVASTTLGDGFFYQIVASNNPQTFGATGLPAGLNFDPNTGQISGVPQVFGTFQISIEASNPGGDGSVTLNLDIASSGAFVGYMWGPIGGTRPANTPFPVNVRAVDSSGRTVIDHAASLTLSGFVGSGTASTIVLTECWDRNLDLVEFQNVSSLAVDTQGWVVAVNNAFNGIGSVADRVAPLPASMAPGEVISYSDDENNNTFGGDIPWNHRNFFGTGRRGWALIMDSVGQVRDFVVWGYDAGTIAGANVNVNGTNIALANHWTGDGVGWNSGGDRSLQRGGDEDLDTQQAWSWISLTAGSQNSALTVPFTGGAEPIPISPTSAQIADGVWDGMISVNGVTTGAFLLASDGSAPAAISSSFDTIIVTDSDGDGITDAWETANDLDPNSAADAALDNDDDGQTNLEEFLSDTDPNDPTSRLRISRINPSANGDIEIQWDAVPGARYRVMVSFDLASWSELPNSRATGESSTESFTHQGGANGTQDLFYRVEASPLL